MALFVRKKHEKLHLFREKCKDFRTVCVAVFLQKLRKVVSVEKLAKVFGIAEKLIAGSEMLILSPNVTILKICTNLKGQRK